MSNQSKIVLQITEDEVKKILKKEFFLDETAYPSVIKSLKKSLARTKKQMIVDRIDRLTELTVKSEGDQYAFSIKKEM